MITYVTDQILFCNIVYLFLLAKSYNIDSKFRINAVFVWFNV